MEATKRTTAILLALLVLLLSSGMGLAAVLEGFSELTRPRPVQTFPPPFRVVAGTELMPAERAPEGDYLLDESKLGEWEEKLGVRLTIEDHRRSRTQQVVRLEYTQDGAYYSCRYLASATGVAPLSFAVVQPGQWRSLLGLGLGRFLGTLLLSGLLVGLLGWRLSRCD